MFFVQNIYFGWHKQLEIIQSLEFVATGLAALQPLRLQVL